jgi:predicted aspartyl protease
MRIHRIAATAAFLLSAPVAHAQTCSLGLMASLDMTTLPDGRFTVPVSINGSMHPFLVQTGGVFSEVAPRVANALALPQTQTRAEVYGVNGKVHMSSAEVDSFKIGGIEAKRFHLAVSGDDKGYDGYDGTIDPDLLIQFDIELDFAKNKMNVFSQDHCPGKVVYWTKDGYIALPFRMISGPATVNHHIVVTTTLDGHDLSTDLDTSAQTTVLRHKPAVEYFGFDEKSPDVTLAPDKIGGLPVYRKRFGMLHLGGIDAPNPVIDVIPDQEMEAFHQEHFEKSRDDPIYGNTIEPSDMYLGTDVLRKLHVYIAYKEHIIYATTVDAH